MTARHGDGVPYIRRSTNPAPHLALPPGRHRRRYRPAWRRLAVAGPLLLAGAAMFAWAVSGPPDSARAATAQAVFVETSPSTVRAGEQVGLRAHCADDTQTAVVNSAAFGSATLTPQYGLLTAVVNVPAKTPAGDHHVRLSCPDQATATVTLRVLNDGSTDEPTGPAPCQTTDCNVPQCPATCPTTTESQCPAACPTTTEPQCPTSCPTTTAPPPCGATSPPVTTKPTVTTTPPTMTPKTTEPTDPEPSETPPSGEDGTSGLRLPIRPY